MLTPTTKIYHPEYGLGVVVGHNDPEGKSTTIRRDEFPVPYDVRGIISSSCISVSPLRRFPNLIIFDSGASVIIADTEVDVVN